MAPVNFDVLWYAPERMSFSCCYMLNEIFSSHDTTHHIGFGIDSRKELPKLNGAVIIFHGGNEAAIGRGPALAAIMSAELVNYPWVLFINCGDEEDAFPLHLLAHKNFAVWTQTPKAGGTNADVADFHFIEGYHHDTRSILDSLPAHERDLDFFFAGQNTHERRNQCVNALKACRNPFAKQYARNPHGGLMYEAFDISSIIIPTDGFGKGVSHETYYEFMRRAKIVPCPAGPATPDSFRMAEALEAGCVPVLDAWSPEPHRAPGYWDLVFGDHPFFVIEDWEKEWRPVMDEILGDYERHQRACAHFWLKYKLSFRQRLLRDMISLGAI